MAMNNNKIFLKNQFLSTENILMIIEKQSKMKVMLYLYKYILVFKAPLKGSKNLWQLKF